MADTIKSDFIQSIGTAQIIATINIVTIKCSCIKKEVIMGQMGIPMKCPSCNKVWFVSATAKIKIQEILLDSSRELILPNSTSS